MKYFRLMSIEEARKFFNGEVLTREGQKNWFLETSNFYFVSEDQGGLTTLRKIAQTFINEFAEELFIIGFESEKILPQTWQEDYEIFESICEEYSSQDFKCFGYIRSTPSFFYDEWVDNPFIEGIPYIQKPIIRTPKTGEIYKGISFSKSFNDKNFSSENKKENKKRILNRRKDRLVKYSIR